jgi:hypothetical protein
MKQLELNLYPTCIRIFTPLDKLARHMRMFRVDFTYDELLKWHKEANALTQQVSKR